MISNKDFYPLLGSMSVEQKNEYLLAMQAWINDSSNLISDNCQWSDEQTKSFDEGLRLLSVGVAARQFCLNAYKLSADKRLKYFRGHMCSLIDSLRSRGMLSAAKPNSQPVMGKMSESSVKALQQQMDRLQKKADKGRPAMVRVPEIPNAQPDESLRMVSADGTDPLRADVTARRPQHLDQYIDMLPEDIQQQALRLSGLYLEMSELSHQLDTLCDNKRSYKGDRAIVAQKLCAIEDKISLIWKKVDAAYAEATGKEVSDDYKLFLEAETMCIEGEGRERTPGEMTRYEIENIQDEEERERCKQARIERDKKHLRRTDRQSEGEGAEKFRQSLIAAAEELHEWGILITDTQQENCRKFGYEVPSEWCEPSAEERQRQRKDERNRKAREQRAAAKAEKKAQAEAAAEEAAAPYTQEGLTIYD